MLKSTDGLSMVGGVQVYVRFTYKFLECFVAVGIAPVLGFCLITGISKL